MSSVYRDGGFEREPAEPLRKEVFNGPPTPDQMTRLQAAIAEATEATRRNRGNTKVTFEAVACGTAGATITLRHNLGRVPRWRVVDWARTTPGGTHGLERSSSDETTLVLASYVAGTATIEVE